MTSSSSLQSWCRYIRMKWSLTRLEYSINTLELFIKQSKPSSVEEKEDYFHLLNRIVNAACKDLTVQDSAAFRDLDLLYSDRTFENIGFTEAQFLASTILSDYRNRRSMIVAGIASIAVAVLAVSTGVTVGLILRYI